MSIKTVNMCYFQDEKYMPASIIVRAAINEAEGISLKIIKDKPAPIKGAMA